MSAGKKQIIWIFLIFLLSYFPLCNRINSYCIQSWDESRNITNAIEMLDNHKYITRYFENKPDMWDLKPPFLVWFQVLSFRLLGFTETAARLPSMVFSLLTVAFLLWMGWKLNQSLLTGFLGVLILVSSQGYIGEHMARFGDHEAMLGFFVCTMTGFAWLFSETGDNRYLLGFILSLFLGWFTKNIIAFMFLPGMFFWFTGSGKLHLFFKNKVFWIATASMVLLIVSYYLARESSSPGYIKEVWMNELFGRYFDQSENYHYHKNEFWYYWKGFTEGRFNPYVYWFLAGMAFALFRPDLKHRKFLLFTGIILLCYFFVLSAGTKNFWYDGPVYPMAALFIGVFIIALFDYMVWTPGKWILAGLLALNIIPAYARAVEFTLQPDKNASHPLQSMCYYLKDSSNPVPQKLVLLPEGFYTPLYFYIAQKKSENKKLQIKKWSELQAGDTFLIHESNWNSLKDSSTNKAVINQKSGCVLGVVRE